MLLAGLCGFGAMSSLPAAVVQTLDGRTIQGHIQFEAGDSLLITPSNEPPARIAFTSLLRADFNEPTNAPPPVSPRLQPLAMDEERGAMPAPWQNLDIGGMQRPGSAVHYHGTFTVESSRRTSSDGDKGFHFVCQPFRGDGEIVARVASIRPRDEKERQAWAGVMMRASLADEARTLMVAVTGSGGMTFSRRKGREGGATPASRPDLKPPYWVRLRREGKTITSHHSTDGRRWAFLGQTDEELPDRIYFGLAVKSNRRDEPATGEFDHVTVRALEPRGPFAPRVVLKDGSVITDHIRLVDDTAITFSAARKGLTVLTRHVARLQFQPLDDPESIPAGRSGVLMATGDFVDGEFLCVSNNRVRLGSVLFGQRSYELNRKVAAVVLRDVTAQAAAFEVKTLDGSVWRARSISVEADALKLDTAFAGSIRIPQSEVREIARQTQAL